MDETAIRSIVLPDEQDMSVGAFRWHIGDRFHTRDSLWPNDVEIHADAWLLTQELQNIVLIREDEVTSNDFGLPRPHRITQSDVIFASDRPVLRQQAEIVAEASETKEARSLADFEKQLYKRAKELVDIIGSSLLEDVRDSDLDKSDIPWQSAISACVELSAKLSLFIAYHPEVKSAAFVDEGGGVSLVLQSIESKRRVNFLIEPNGLAADVCQLDQAQAITHSRVELMDSQATRECAEWVTIKAK